MVLANNYTDVEDCRLDCQSAGGDIASIHSDIENRVVQSLMKENLVWIGGRIEKVNGTFEWVDGTPWNYDDWDERKC